MTPIMARRPAWVGERGEQLVGSYSSVSLPFYFIAFVLSFELAAMLLCQFIEGLTVLKLADSLLRQRLGREARGEAERVPQQRDLARGAASHVVRLDGRLLKELEDADDAENLELARFRHGVPRGVALAAERLEGDALLDREVAREERAARRHPRPAGDSGLRQRARARVSTTAAGARGTPAPPRRPRRTIATRECFSSAARYHARVSGEAILDRPIGSKTLLPVSTPTPSLHAGASGGQSARPGGAPQSQGWQRAFFLTHMSATPMRTAAAAGATRGRSAGPLNESDETERESMVSARVAWRVSGPGQAKLALAVGRPH